ncbi:MAG: hypothetical protein SVY53_05425 [Chloroflexota bacterium]|nr:hypothetical protein [Chloroflexota bacterium]
MGVYYSKGAGMNLVEIEKEIRGAQRLLDNSLLTPIDDIGFIVVETDDYTAGYNKLERLCEFINDMIDQDCDIYRR